MRLTVLATTVLLACGASWPVVAQETETPSSRPAPEPGAPPPPLSAPRDGGVAASPDRAAAQAAVRAQCGPDRARLCRQGGDACLSSHFAQLGTDCQSALTALKQSQGERAAPG